MSMLHDPAVRTSLRSRLERLTPEAKRRWGRMSADQMLWHCNQILGTALGEVQIAPIKPPIPLPILKFLLFDMPWPHNMPTRPEYVAVAPHVFNEERQRCLLLIDQFTSRSVDETSWGRAAFAPLTGSEWSRLQAKHLDYHLVQFGA